MEKLIQEILAKENINYIALEKSESGFSNDVFFVDNNYVIKISKENKSYKLDKEAKFYQNAKMNHIPKFIKTGTIKNRTYLIIEKIDGISLYNIWHTLSENQREKIILQLTDILKELNNQNYEFLDKKYINQNWAKKWENSFDINIKELSLRGFDTSSLQNFKETKLETIMKEQNLKLLFNDGHFDNFLFTKNNELFIIDFDRMFYGSLDYELLIIDSMLDNPTKFASLEEEKFVNEKDYANIRSYLKKYYQELFNFEYFEDRLFIYKFIYKLSAGYEYNKNEWLKEDLESFKKHFGYK